MVEQYFDMHAIQGFRARAMRSSASGADFLLTRSAADLAERLAFIDRKFAHAAITSGTGAYVTGNPLLGTRHEQTQLKVLPVQGWPQYSEENLHESCQDLDLAVSLLSLHETNDTPGALIQIRRALRPDGLFMGVMPGGITLQELRQCLIEAETEIYGGASPRVYPFADVRAAGSLLQRAGFALPVVDSETITVRYDDMFALLRDIRAMGASNALTARSRKPVSKKLFLTAAKIYQERFAQEDGRIPATFEMIWMSGWAPDASQQKPAKRGSATVSLADALKLDGN